MYTRPFFSNDKDIKENLNESSILILLLLKDSIIGTDNGNLHLRRLFLQHLDNDGLDVALPATVRPLLFTKLPLRTSTNDQRNQRFRLSLPRQGIHFGYITN